MSGVWNAKKGVYELNLCREDYRYFAELIKKFRDSAGLQQSQQAWGCVLNSCSTFRVQGPKVIACAPTNTLLLLQFTLLLNVAHSLSNYCHNSLKNEANTVTDKLCRTALSNATTFIPFLPSASLPWDTNVNTDGNWSEAPGICRKVSVGMDSTSKGKGHWDGLYPENVPWGENVWL